MGHFKWKTELKQNTERCLHWWDAFILNSNAISPWPLANWLSSWKNNRKAVRYKQELWGRNNTVLLIIIPLLLWTQSFLSAKTINPSVGSLKVMLFTRKEEPAFRRLKLLQYLREKQAPLLLGLFSASETVTFTTVHTVNAYVCFRHMVCLLWSYPFLRPYLFFIRLMHQDYITVLSQSTQVSQ